MQLSANDPYFCEDYINWVVVRQSTKHPFKDRHGVYQVLHSLACRTSRSPTYTDSEDIQLGLQHGFNELRTCFLSSVQFISHDAPFNPHEVNTEGPEAVPVQSVAFSQAMSWVFGQVSFQDKQDGQKIDKHGIWKLRKRFWEVLLAVLIIGESKMYSDQAAQYRDPNKTQQQLALYKKDLRKKTILTQLIPKSKNHRQQVGAFRKKCLQSLSLFSLYGTAGFFPVWRDDTRPTVKEAAQLLHLASTFTLPRHDPKPDHEFNSRPYVRCDTHLMGLVQNVITESQFEFDFDWENMTKRWREDMNVGYLAHMFVTDFCTELLKPGFSRGLSGNVMDSVLAPPPPPSTRLAITGLQDFLLDGMPPDQDDQDDNP